MSWILNDPPPKFGAELAECQRYFVRIGIRSGISAGFFIPYNSHNGNYVIPVPQPMRANPTVAFHGNFEFRGAGETKAISMDGRTTSMYAGTVMINDNLRNFEDTFPPSEVFHVLTSGANSYIDISSDL